MKIELDVTLHEDVVGGYRLQVKSEECRYLVVDGPKGAVLGALREWLLSEQVEDMFAQVDKRGR